MIDFDSLHKLPKNVRDLGNIVVAKALKSCPICKKITQSGHTAPSLFYIPTRYVFIELTLPSDILLYLLCILSLSCTPSPSFSLTHSLPRTHTISLSLTNTNTYFDHAWASYVSEQVEKTRSLMLWRMRSLSWSPKVKFWVRPSWRRYCSFCYAYTPLLPTYLPVCVHFCVPTYLPTPTRTTR